MTDNAENGREAFVRYLYGLHYWSSSDNRKRAGEARQALARLRRVFTGVRQQADAYEYVFVHDPPEREQEAWLLVAGLFALHPHPRPRRTHPRSLGASTGKLAASSGPATTRRFTQLLARDGEALPYNLRQTLRLLASHDIAVDYDQLLDDLVVLMDSQERPDEAHRVRLRWAREFHRPLPSGPTDNEDRSAQPPVEVEHLSALENQ